MPPLILLVNADRTALRQTEAMLSDAGYLVAAASSFKEGKESLDSKSPDLLIADVRLGAFNGLHLALRSRFDHPGLPVIITHTVPDVVLENEAKRHGAGFVVDPLNTGELLRCVHAALSGDRDAQSTVRRWPRRAISGNVAAQVATSQARVLDMSYGGLRLAFEAQQDVPALFDVTFPTVGITVRAHRIWANRSPATDEFWCGAELLDTVASAGGDWRDFVDSAH